MKNNWLTLKSLFLCVSALGVSGLILSGCTENANLNPEKRLGRFYKNQAFQKVQKRNVHEKR